MNEPAWLTIARGLLGLREIPGPQNNPEIVALWRDAGLPFTDDEVAWCAGFVGGVLARAKIKPSGRADARSYIGWGIDVFEDRNIKRIPLGAVIIFARPPAQWSGHVGFAVGIAADGRVMCLGGNQKNMVSILPFDAERTIGARYPLEMADDLRIEYQLLPLITTNLNSSHSEV